MEVWVSEWAKRESWRARVEEGANCRLASCTSDMDLAHGFGSMEVVGYESISAGVCETIKHVTSVPSFCIFLSGERVHGSV